jgi:hypothetical protein
VALRELGTSRGRILDKYVRMEAGVLSGQNRASVLIQ